MRILKSNLDDALSALNRATNNTRDYSYDKAYGGYRLVKENGSVEVSPRLPKRAMYDWVWAYIYGYQEAKPKTFEIAARIRNWEKALEEVLPNHWGETRRAVFKKAIRDGMTE